MLAPQISASFHDENSNLQNFESEKGCRWHQDSRLELQMSWSNRDIWSLCPWWLRLSTGLSYFIDCLINQTAKKKKKSNCNLHPITMNSGMVECWRTGSGSKYQQGHFLANLREELCLGPDSTSYWLAPTELSLMQLDWTSSSGFCDYVTLCPWQGTDGGTDVPLQGNDSGLHWLDTKWLSSREHPRDLELLVN